MTRVFPHALRFGPVMDQGDVTVSHSNFYGRHDGKNRFQIGLMVLKLGKKTPCWGEQKLLFTAQEAQGLILTPFLI